MIPYQRANILTCWVLVLLNGACAKVASESLDAGVQDAAPDQGTVADAGAGHDDSQCPWGAACGYAVEDGCGAQKRCVPTSSTREELRCGCSGSDLLAGNVAQEPVAHVGSCKGPDVNCDFNSPGNRDVLSRLDNADCLKTPCPAGYICEVQPTLIEDGTHVTFCYRGPSRCGERATCDCITPCACRLDQCTDADSGAICNLLPPSSQH